MLSYSITSINVDSWTLEMREGNVLFVEPALAARQRRVFGIFGSASATRLKWEYLRHKIPSY